MYLNFVIFQQAFPFQEPLFFNIIILYNGKLLQMLRSPKNVNRKIQNTLNNIRTIKLSQIITGDHQEIP